MLWITRGTRTEGGITVNGATYDGEQMGQGSWHSDAFVTSSRTRRSRQRRLRCGRADESMGARREEGRSPAPTPAATTTATRPRRRPPPTATGTADETTTATPTRRRPRRRPRRRNRVATPPPAPRGGGVRVATTPAPSQPDTAWVFRAARHVRPSLRADSDCRNRHVVWAKVKTAPNRAKYTGDPVSEKAPEHRGFFLAAVAGAAALETWPDWVLAPWVLLPTRTGPTPKKDPRCPESFGIETEPINATDCYPRSISVQKYGGMQYSGPAPRVTGGDRRIGVERTSKAIGQEWAIRPDNRIEARKRPASCPRPRCRLATHEVLPRTIPHRTHRFIHNGRRRRRLHAKGAFDGISRNRYARSRTLVHLNMLGPRATCQQSGGECRPERGIEGYAQVDRDGAGSIARGKQRSGRTASQCHQQTLREDGSPAAPADGLEPGPAIGKDIRTDAQDSASRFMTTLAGDLNFHY